MKIIILAAGEGTRWGNHLGVPKQLAPINGQPLLNRMIEQMRGRGEHDITLVTHDERLKRAVDCEVLEPKYFEWTVESVLSTHHLWSKENLILLGDVIYSKGAIEKMLSGNIDCAFFGRPGASKFTFKRFGEIFAFRFSCVATPRIEKALAEARRDAQSGGGGKLWQLYRALEGLSLSELGFSGNSFLEINDFTDDIDSPREYIAALRRLSWGHSSNVLKRTAARLYVEALGNGMANP